MFLEIAKKNNKINTSGDYECPLTLPHLVLFY